MERARRREEAGKGRGHKEEEASKRKEEEGMWRGKGGRRKKREGMQGEVISHLYGRKLR